MLTKAERAAMNDLETLAMQSMRSKPVLRALAKLEAQGLIRLNPFEGTATITDAGRKALAALSE